MKSSDQKPPVELLRPSGAEPPSPPKALAMFCGCNVAQSHTIDVTPSDNNSKLI